MKDHTRNVKGDRKILSELFPQKIVDHISTSIIPPKLDKGNDKPCWMLDTNGVFTVKSAWQYIRHMEDKSRVFR